MSFLDEQATGQIGIGEKAGLSTLTRRKRKRKKGQAPTGTETYSLLPQNEFSNIVSKPSDITQVGIGKDLLAQGTAASEVPNVFEQYKTAAPKGSTYEALYGGEDDDEPDDDAIIDELESDPLPDISVDASQAINPGFSTYNPDGTYSGQVGVGDKNFESFTAMLESVAGAANRGLGNVTRGLGTAVTKGLFGEGTEDRQNLGRSLGFGVGIGNPAEGKYASSVDPASIFEGREGMAPQIGPQSSTFEGQSISARSLDPVAVQAAKAQAAQDSYEAAEATNISGADAGSGAGGAAPAAPSASDVSGWEVDVGNWASGGTVTKSKAKNKKSFMSMKGK